MVAPYGPEGVGRLVDVELQQGLPRLVVVLRQQPVVGTGGPVDQGCGDPQGPLQPPPVTRHVGRREERLDRVHVGVGAAIGVAGRPVRAPLVDDEPGRVVPEVRLHDVERLGEQGGPLRVARTRGGGRGQDHEGVRIGLLGGLPLGAGRRPLRTDRVDDRVVLGASPRRVPAPVHGVTQPGPQGLYAVVDLGRRRVVATQRGEGKDVRHACGDPRQRRPTRGQLAAIPEPAEATSGITGGVGEVDQPISLGGEPAESIRSGMRGHVGTMPRQAATSRRRATRGARHTAPTR